MEQPIQYKNNRVGGKYTFAAAKNTLESEYV
uniref:Uncharacterized protein n=1 Tax=Aliivibrio wodanis TaxID=80852 RepID=A0A5Q4Z429_9GAMM|nr:hypothetical protein AW0309160_00693 [Aliivibrio wodanis]